jgi:O-antigen ligase
MTQQLHPWIARTVVAMTIAYIALVPLCLPSIYTGRSFDAARALQVLLMGACAAALVTSVRHTYLPRSALVLLGAVSISVLLAESWGMALREVAGWGGLIAVAWFTSRSIKAEQLQWATVAGVGLHAAVVLLLGISTYSIGMAVGREDLFIGYDNRRHLNHVQTVAIPLLALAGLTTKSALLRRLAWVSLSMSFSLLALSAGRATAISIFLGLAIAIVVSPDRASALTRFVLKGAATGLAIYLLAFVFLPILLGVKLEASTDLAASRLMGDQSRLFLWREAVDAWTKNPWFGVGPMHLAHQFNGKAAHPHNFPLQMLAEWGVIAASTALLWLVSAGRHLLARIRAAEGLTGNAGSALAMVWVAVIVDACFSGNLVLPVSQVWIAIAAGWTWKVSREENTNARPEARTGIILITTVVVLLLPLWLAATVAAEWPDLQEQQELVAEKFASERLHPRFWSHGWF